MDNVITETLNIILGDKPVSYYFAGFFFSLIAITLAVYLHSRNRDISSTNTPKKFSITFLIWDNFKRAVTGMMVMFLIFRVFDCSNIGVMIGVGFFISFGVDKAIVWLMENFSFMKFLKTDRNAFPRINSEE